MKTNVTVKDYLKHVNLTFDSMSIRKQVLYDKKRGRNFVGSGLRVDDDETLASEALVFQIVALRGSFKCAVTYFFINKITSTVLAQLIKMAVLKLHSVGVNVHNVTFDGLPANITAKQKLGCKFHEDPFF